MLKAAQKYNVNFAAIKLTLHLKSQLYHALHRFRVFSFGAILFGEMGRLLRWDRSGVVYTEAFKWKTQPDTLCEFF